MTGLIVPLIERCVAILGTGRIASSVVRQLGDAGTSVHATPSPTQEAEPLDLHNCALAIVMEDELTGTITPLADKLRHHGTPFLTISGRMNRVFIGPLELPSSLGCSTCVNIRWMNSLRLSPLLTSFNEKLEHGAQMRLPLTVKDDDIRVVAEFVATEVSNIFRAHPSMMEGKVGVMRAGATHVEVVTLVPSNDCPRCNEGTVSHVKFTEAAGRTHISVPHSLRVRNIDADTLHDTFVHADIGLISRLDVKQLTGSHVGVHAHLQLPNQNTAIGSSVDLTIDDAKRTAILEALERTCGRYPSRLCKSTIGTYDGLSNTALHPSVFGLHDEETYSAVNGRYQRFRTDELYHWVEGFSYRSQTHVLVPEQLAYHGIRRQGEPKFVQQTSNGCAIGGAFEEAILYGLLEVVERDAFLNTWYGKLPVPEIDIADVMSGEVLPWVEQLGDNGYDIRLFNISHDFMIPCVLAVALNRHNQFPKVVCGNAAHLLPNIAFSKAIRELASQVFTLNAATPEKIASAQEKLLSPSRIETISDHRLVGALPEAHAHWSFLLDGPRRFHEPWVTWQQAREEYKLSSNDMTTILNAVLDDMFHHGFDVIVVPQTRIEIESAGLHAARVLVPGMTPMTFGYDYRRIQGLERVLQLPYKLGYSARPLQIEELNTDPHPFG